MPGTGTARRAPVQAPTTVRHPPSRSSGGLPDCAATLATVTTARRPAWRAAVTAVVLLAIGLGVALGVGSALGISAEPVAGMDAVSRRGRHGRPRRAAADDRGASTARGTERTTVALDELTDAVAVGPDAGSGRATLTLRAGDGDPDDDTYRLGGDASALEVTAASESGAVRAVYDLAAAVRSGHAGDRAPRRRGHARACRSGWSTSAPSG